MLPNGKNKAEERKGKNDKNNEKNLKENIQWIFSVSNLTKDQVKQTQFPNTMFYFLEDLIN